jgi:hypothetical protein
MDRGWLVRDVKIENKKTNYCILGQSWFYLYWRKEERTHVYREVIFKAKK